MLVNQKLIVLFCSSEQRSDIVSDFLVFSKISWIFTPFCSLKHSISFTFVSHNVLSQPGKISTFFQVHPSLNWCKFLSGHFRNLLEKWPVASCILSVVNQLVLCPYKEQFCVVAEVLRHSF